MKYWQNYKRRIKLFLLKGREKKELPCSETENSFGENIIPLFEIENSFGENFDQAKTKTQIKKNFLP
jgi:hypothetical protein